MPALLSRKSRKLSASQNHEIIGRAGRSVIDEGLSSTGPLARLSETPATAEDQEERGDREADGKRDEEHGTDLAIRKTTTQQIRSRTAGFH